MVSSHQPNCYIKVDEINILSWSVCGLMVSQDVVWLGRGNAGRKMATTGREQVKRCDENMVAILIKSCDLIRISKDPDVVDGT